MAEGRFVFICHSSHNAAQARQVVDWLESNRVACWISSRDIEPGDNYQTAIVRAIRASRLVVFLFSEEANQSREVMKELSLASSFAIPLLPLRMSDVKPNEALLYELSTSQWVDGWPDLQHALDRLLRAVEGTTTRPDWVVPDDGMAARSTPDAVATPMKPLVLSKPELETLRLLLARHVGPIAGVLLRRTLDQSATPEELCVCLATHLPGALQRTEFVRTALAGLARR